ncbi:MAG: 4-hydroxybenzoate octaprenyltransferase [Thalassobaculales bacterium]
MSASASDIRSGDWVDRLLPAPARPYARLARLDRPIGTWLLLLPCWWGLALAGAHDPALYLLFAIGAIAMRGAGCTINDLWDRDIDRLVARTRDRPLASGALGLRQAFAFLAAQLGVGLAVLLLLPPFAWLLGAAVMALVVTYPLAKRVTDWPQAVLGLTFNWGALMGYAAVTGTLSWAAVALYAAGFFWTLGYDTIYAHQDKADDAIVGVRSTALLLGGWTKPAMAGFYAVAVALLAMAVPTPLLALPALHLAWQIWRLDTADPANCLMLFRANRDAGLLVWLAILLG